MALVERCVEYYNNLEQEELFLLLGVIVYFVQYFSLLSTFRSGRC